ncbi:MAG: hypothetical protein OHK0056_08970 [Bacteriovoracaceae bacterium]
MSNVRNTMHMLTLASLYVIATSLFTSNSVSALHHILVFIPSIYFLIEAIKKDEWSLPWSWWALGALFDVCFFSVLVNTDIIENPVNSIFRAKYFLITLMMIYPLRALFKEYIQPKHIKHLLWLILISTSIASISGLIALYTGFNPLKMKPSCHPERACGLYGMYMTYGYGIALFMVVNVGLWLKRKMFSQYIPTWLITASLAINGMGMILSYARGAWIAFFIAVPFYFFKKHKKAFLLTTLGGIVISTLAISFIPSINRMFLDRSGSNDQRMAFWKASIKAFEERPILGYGYKNFEPHTKEIKSKFGLSYPEVAGHAHNNFLEHLASTGAIGFVVLLLFHWFWLKESYQRDDLVAFVSFPFVIAFFTSGMVQYTFGDGENLFLIMGLFALFHAVQPNIKSSVID